MIFDSPQMQQLRNKYADRPISRVPHIVFLDRHPDLATEREYLERLMVLAPVPEAKKRDWLGRLLSADERQHLGAWFELMLYGWLLDTHMGQVVPAPSTEWGEPDFLLDLGFQQLIIEARVHLIQADRRELEKKVAEVWNALGEIRKPFLVDIEQIELPVELDLAQLVGDVVNWLDSTPHERFSLVDKHGTRIVLSARPYPNSKRVLLVQSLIMGDVTPETIKPPLREKASKYKKAREAGYIYIIALFLEPSELSAETVAEAWLGRTQYVIDVERKQVREVRSDMSGLHFFGSQVRHTTVSGTLVFQAQWNRQAGRHNLVASYIQNPYAKAPFDGACFPLEESFVVVGHNATSYTMDWRPKRDTSSESDEAW